MAGGRGRGRRGSQAANREKQGNDHTREAEAIDRDGEEDGTDERAKLTETKGRATGGGDAGTGQRRKTVESGAARAGPGASKNRSGRTGCRKGRGKERTGKGKGEKGTRQGRRKGARRTAEGSRRNRRTIEAGKRTSNTKKLKIREGRRKRQKGYKLTHRDRQEPGNQHKRPPTRDEPGRRHHERDRARGQGPAKRERRADQED
uniref:Uncharacterized protein n=1 Tax=Knipowitschia caucasica TaxID=637954 RepID=A0AAV2J545_KNICA